MDRLVLDFLAVLAVHLLYWQHLTVLADLEYL
jgi:hypothetical protein